AGAAWAQPTKFQEAPVLAEQVKAGKLPPVDKRLPADPLVVPVAERTGQYGGVWRRAFLGPADANNYIRVVYDALVRFSPDGAKIEPKIAAGWESSKDFQSWTIKLRQGARWSDGASFTADDIVFWYQDVLLNKDLVPALPSWMRNADGTPASVEKASATAVRWTYKQPNTLLLTALANQDGGDRTYAVFLPAHYLKRFHPTYTKKEELDKLVAAAGFKTWTELFAARNAPPENPERPTMAAWAPATRVSDQVFTLKRNPYFVGVDPSGNQLPYLDEVRFTFFTDIQALNLATIAGEFDMQERHIQMTNYPVSKETEKSGKCRVITWPTFGVAAGGPAGRQGRGESRRVDRRPAAGARAALHDARQQRADDRDVERGHDRLPVHRQREVRPAQLAEPHAGATLRPLGADQGRRGRRAAGSHQAHHGDRGSGQDRRARAAGEAGAGAVPDLGRQPLGGRHDRADADGAGHRGDQHAIPQRPDDARQRLAASQ